MPPHLLNLPTELLEHILTILCHENAQSIQACRQACRKLNTIIAQSRLVQYLERVALLGMCHVGGGAASATLALRDRVVALRAWEESWNVLAGGHDGDGGVFWQERAPDLRIALPPSLLSSSAAARARYIGATIIEPEPPVAALGPGQYEEEGQHGILEAEDHFSFGPWFIAATRSGFNVRASYSYLDLYGCLGGRVGEGEEAPEGVQSGEEEEDGDRGVDYDRVHWTVIKVPVRNVVSFALSTELDLAVVISCVCPHSIFCLLVPIRFLQTNRAKVKFDGQGEERCHLVVRPLRFRDGTPHPCANVPTMRFSVTGASVFHQTHVQVLGDYLLLWIGPGGDYGLTKLYLIAWKQGSITLVSFH